MGPEAHPLHWPAGWPRAKRRRDALYKVSFARARDELLNELRLMSARGVVLSSNLELRRDRLPYANQREPDDPGIAVYWTLKGEAWCMACDHWRKVKDNVRAVGLTVAAIRSIQRAGASELLDRAFSGFKRLPSSGVVTDWRVTLGIDPNAPLTKQAIKEAYWVKLLQVHPDRPGGSDERTSDVHKAYQAAREEVA